MRLPGRHQGARARVWEGGGRPLARPPAHPPTHPFTPPPACPPSQYFDAVVNDARGEVVVIKKAVCMHEEDYGISWKHFEYRDGNVEVRRLRRLVISFIATIGESAEGGGWGGWCGWLVWGSGRPRRLVILPARPPAPSGQPRHALGLCPHSPPPCCSHPPPHTPPRPPHPPTTNPPTNSPPLPPTSQLRVRLLLVSLPGRHHPV